MAGRKPGTPNKVTAGAKANIIRVFEEIGGVKNFAEWARQNQSEFYKHYAKLIPLTIGGDETHPLTIVISPTAAKW